MFNDIVMGGHGHCLYIGHWPLVGFTFGTLDSGHGLTLLDTGHWLTLHCIGTLDPWPLLDFALHILALVFNAIWHSPLSSVWPWSCSKGEGHGRFLH